MATAGRGPGGRPQGREVVGGGFGEARQEPVGSAGSENRSTGVPGLTGGRFQPVHNRSRL